MPMPGGGTMYRLLCGSTLVKLVDSRQGAARRRPARRHRRRLRLPLLDDLGAQPRRAHRHVRGRRLQVVPIKPREIRPGVRISMIEDPDGNWVELLEVTPQN